MANIFFKNSCCHAYRKVWLFVINADFKSKLPLLFSISLGPDTMKKVLYGDLEHLLIITLYLTKNNYANSLFLQWTSDFYILYGTIQLILKYSDDELVDRLKKKDKRSCQKISMTRIMKLRPPLYCYLFALWVKCWCYQLVLERIIIYNALMAVCT